jgi:hypothetical protein
MHMRAYKHARLMEESERCVETTARSGLPDDMLVANRILEQPVVYQRWENAHDQLMRSVSEQAWLSRQMVALRFTAISLIHRKAMFEYLRDQHIVGDQRVRMFSLFYGSRDYAHSVIAEHGSYIRYNSSYFCTQFLADELMRDEVFQDPLQLYEEWYSEYFRVFCDVALASTGEEKRAVSALETLKPFLRHRLDEVRKTILALPRIPGRSWREAEIRKPTGDTVKLRSLLADSNR